MRSSAPRPDRSLADPSSNILGSKLFTGATIRTNFFLFFLFSIVFYQFFLLFSSFLLFLSLLILLVGSIFRFLMLLLLYFKLLLYYILMIYTYPSFWGVFRWGQAFFDPFGVRPYGLTFFCFILFYSSLYISSYSSLVHYILPLLILLFLYLNCLLYYRAVYQTHTGLRYVNKWQN